MQVYYTTQETNDMEKLLSTLFLSLGDVIDWLAADPAVRAVMPSEMYDLNQQRQHSVNAD